uniref:Uncharacterized protein n=1 Tax=Anguilla anguilla TaxID=7936 RepID=A0A0E9V3D3_ANGAN
MLMVPNISSPALTVR